MKLNVLVSSVLGVALAGLMVTSAAAQSPAAQDRSNKGAATTGDARADLVQSENKKKDKDKDPAPDNDKNKGKHKGETKGKHNAKGHRH